MRILVATDGSPHSQPALDAVLSRPWPEGTIVRVLVAVPYPYLFTTYEWYVAEQALAATINEESKRHAQSVADEADLIIMGSHGHTGLRKFLLGSVAQHVISHAPCSVEVARARGRDQGAPSD